MKPLLMGCLCCCWGCPGGAPGGAPCCCCCCCEGGGGCCWGKGKPDERPPPEGEQSLAVDHTADCSICMESLHWLEGGRFIW